MNIQNFEYPKKTQKKEKGCCAAVHSACDQHPFSGILVQWFVPPVLNFFDSLQDDRSYFPPAFLVCRWYPELFSSLIWDVLVLLYIDSAAVHLRKSTDICRWSCFILIYYLSNLPLNELASQYRWFSNCFEKKDS